MSGSLKSQTICSPKSLIALQEWFVKRMSRPLQQGSLSFLRVEEHIISQGLLCSYERLEIYQHGYWSRLIGVLENDFPLLHYLMGTTEFSDEIAVPYLEEYPANHWSLDKLGELLPGWIEDHFNGKEKVLLKEAALLELALLHASIAGVGKQLNLELTGTLFLRPFVTLLPVSYNWLPFRNKLLDKEVSYWGEHSFPELKKKNMYLVVFRRKNRLEIEVVDSVHYEILQKIEKGITLDALCEVLESFSEQEYLQEHFQTWMKQSIEWIE